MSRSPYVISLVTGAVDLRFPSGTVSQGLYAGHPYLASEACVKQYPHLFRPSEPAPAEPTEQGRS
jgi:hypothetical protein